MNRILVASFAAVLSCAALAQGPGPGAPAGKGPGWRFGAANTSGWSLMTAEERTAHRDKMLAMKTYDECKAYQAEHHANMAARAKEKGQALPEAPRANMCDRMKSAGRLN